MASPYPTPWVGVPGRSLTDRAAFETSTMPYRGSLPQSPGKVVPCVLESRASWPGKYWNGICNCQMKIKSKTWTVYLNRRNLVPQNDKTTRIIGLLNGCLVIYTQPLLRSRQIRDSLDFIVIQSLQSREVLGLLNHHVTAKSDACMPYPAAKLHKIW